jgi:hypothetical protein
MGGRKGKDEGGLGLGNGQKECRGKGRNRRQMKR